MKPVEDIPLSERSERVPPPIEPPSALAPSVAHYDLLGKIGEGSTAVVYSAFDRHLKRPVAVKFLRDIAASDNSTRKRFLREAQAAAQLSHPNVVAVYDVGEDDGSLYLVMEIVEGKSLREILDGPPIKVREMVSILERVARGIHHAHEHRIIHRDIKPSNILMSLDGEPKVTDFGLAHIADVEAGLTQAGMMMGTPKYMAPEQVQGFRRLISARTDVYALGAVLYEALTGRAPFPGQTVMEIYGKIVKGNPVPPRKIRSTLSPTLEAIALKAMNRDPERRYATAKAFADDLRNYLAVPVPVRAPSVTSRLLESGMGRRTALVWIILSLGLSMAFGTLVLHRFFAGDVSSVDPDRNAAEVRRSAELQREAYALLETGRPALERMQRAGYDRNANFPELLRRVEESRRQFESAAAKAPSLPLARHLLGIACELQGFPDVALSSWRKTVELDPSFTAARFRLGRLLLIQAYLSSASTSEEERETARADSERQLREAAVEIALSLDRNPESGDEMQSQRAEVMLAYCRRDPESTRKLARAALDRYAGQEGAEEFHWLLGLVTAGEEQRHHFDRALTLCSNHPLARFSRAILRQSRGDLEGALEDYDRALAVQPRLIPALNNRAVLHYLRGRFEKTESDAAEAIRLRPEYAAAYIHLGLARFRMKKLEEALRDLDRAVELSPRSVEARNNRGNVRLARGDFDGAIADYSEVMKLRPRNPEACFNRAVAYRAKGDAPAALTDVQTVLKSAPTDWPGRSNAELLLNELKRKP